MKEIKIIVLANELGKETAKELNGKTFNDDEELENAIREAYSKKEKDEWEEENVDIEDLIDELGIYTLDEYMDQLNGGTYPIDLWVTKIYM